MKPLISVIIPVYNHTHTLQKCVESVFAQTHKPIEVIIVNDGSTDKFQDVVEEIRRKFTVKILEQQNKGASSARNLGFWESGGEYVIFWDADTVAKPEMLEKMADTLLNNPMASYAYSQFKFGWKTIGSHEFDPELLKKNNYIDTTSLIKRKDFPGFGESLKRFQDWDLWLALLETGKTGKFIPEVLYTKIVGGTKNISAWLPSFFYKLPWKLKRVREYEEAKKI
ncbi:glycosyltransferase family 2 protein, partial [Patescibacteria group bacterium]|nr:glycosyltransferase family 2 protein [Patescibacteria group bacterium]